MYFESIYCKRINAMNKYKKEDLEKLLVIDNLSYEEVGRLYGVSGVAIKKAALRKNIDLTPRRKINEKETFNKGVYRRERVKCIECGKEFIPYENKSNLYCSQKCQCEHDYKERVIEWQSGKISGHDIRYRISPFVRRYLLEKNNYTCEECGCNLVNKYTGLSILQVHHKDGDASNTKEDNLKVICPNCHAMTENFGSRNKNSIRGYRKEEYRKNK